MEAIKQNAELICSVVISAAIFSLASYAWYEIFRGWWHVEPNTNMQLHGRVLLIDDGYCKVYRFSDLGEQHYYVTCPPDWIATAESKGKSIPTNIKESE